MDCLHAINRIYVTLQVIKLQLLFSNEDLFNNVTELLAEVRFRRFLVGV